MTSNTILIGCGAGFSGDRTDVAEPVVDTLIRRGGPAAIIFENLAERTLAAQQLTKQQDPSLGYEPLLELEVRPILAKCMENNIVIVSNFGAANPHGAAHKVFEIAADLGLPKPRVAVVLGDNLSGDEGKEIVKSHLGEHFDDARFVCANAYQGARPIADAIKSGAQVVITGRVADPSLALGPAMAHYGWADDQWQELAGASMAGHLLECGAQVSGGYFADPGAKDVQGMDNVGFPIAEIFADGSCIVTKADNTGGLVDARTVKEQLLYEVHDPSAYITPDVVADLSACEVTELGPNEVRLSGVIGHPRTDTLKANIFFDGGWFGEGEISYAGPNAEARARLAMDIMQKRLGDQLALRFDLIGISSIFNDDAGELLGRFKPGHHTDVRLRVAAQHLKLDVIETLLREVTALWTGGPAGGGGVRVAKRRRLSTASCLINRDRLPAHYEMLA